MPTDLADRGIVAILLAGISALVAMLIRGDFVPGWIYRQAIARAEKAETQQERNTDALERNTETMKAALEQLRRGG